MHVGVAAAVAAVAGLAVASGSATPPGRNGLLLFQKQVGSITQVFTMAADGGRLRQLTHDPHASERPAWSPDGRTIAFVRRFPSRAAILLMRADGGGLHTLTPTGLQAYPVFTADGRSIVYVRTLSTDQSLWAMDLTGRHQRRLTRGVGDEDPAISPDGKAIAFLRGPQLFVAASDGSRLRRLTPASLEAGGRVEWSPNGSRILFGSGGQIYTIQADGSRLKKLTQGTHDYCSDSFSPDGTRILLIDNCGSDTDSVLYSLSADGGTPTPVPNGHGAHWISWGIGR